MRDEMKEKLQLANIRTIAFIAKKLALETHQGKGKKPPPPHLTSNTFNLQCLLAKNIQRSSDQVPLSSLPSVIFYIYNLLNKTVLKTLLLALS
jgi:hypothetical protein